MEKMEKATGPASLFAQTHGLTLAEAFADGQSKPMIDAVVGWVGADSARLAELMAVFLSENHRLTQRASWAVGDLGVKSPAFLRPFLPDMLAAMDRPGVHDAIKRNVVRILEVIELPFDDDFLIGKIFDSCFRFLENPAEAVAIRAFSMTVCERVAREIPDLKGEVRALLEANLEHEKPAMRHRARTVLAKLNRK